jgi:enterochelin esterase-like enzyme
MRKLRTPAAPLLLFLLLLAPAAFPQEPTYAPVGPDASPRIAALRKQIESSERDSVQEFWNEIATSGAPLIEAISGDTDDSLVTFVWHGDAATRNVVIFDGVAGFDATDRMTRLDDSDVWFASYRVRDDARFAYNFSPNDNLVPFDDIKDHGVMEQRLAAFQIDPLNPHRCPTTFGPLTRESSYVELPDAPPLPWNATPSESTKGAVSDAAIQSAILKSQKKIWIYTPRGFSNGGERYPLLIVFDGDRNVMWIPRILDNLIAQKKIPPLVAVLIDDSEPAKRVIELPCYQPFADFLAKELVPWSQSNYHTTLEASRTIVAGSSYGGLAAVFAALRYPDVFGNVIALSGSFGWKPQADAEPEWLTRQVAAAPKLPLRFYLEVGLMEGSAQDAANRHMRDVLRDKSYSIGYSEYDGGHAFLNWSGGMANGLLFFATADNAHAPEVR